MSLLDNASLVLTPNAYKEGKLYSVIPSNGNGDFTATRATTATRTNAAGLIELAPYNLLTYSEQFDNAIWIKSASSITANATTAPNGTLTADKLVGTGNNPILYQDLLTLNGVSATISVYAKKSELNWLRLTNNSAAYAAAWFNLNTGTIGTITGTAAPTATITSVGDGWYRCTLTMLFSNAAAADLLIACTNADNTTTGYTGDGTSGIFIWGAQLVEGTSARDYLRTETRLNIPRVDYSLGGCPNILLEPQRTNVLLNTVFSGSGAAPTSWTQGATGTSVLTTSNLGAGAQACSQSATSQRPFLTQIFTLLANTTYSYSIYIESIGGALSNEQVLMVGGLPVGATFSYFANGVSVSQSALAVVGRLSITIVVSSTGGSAGFRCGIGTSSNQTGTLLFSRPQLEVGAYSTSFIPTITASVTRNSDTITRNNIYTNGLITAAGGTWFVELRGNISRTRDNSLTIFLGVDINNNLRIRNASNGRLSIEKMIGGTLTNLFATTTDIIKIAFKWNGSTADVFVNGVKEVSSTAFTFTALQELTAACGVPYFINEMALFPTPLTDAQCIALTQ